MTELEMSEKNDDKTSQAGSAGQEKEKAGLRRRFEFTIFVLVFHVIFIILFGFFVRYSPGETIFIDKKGNADPADNLTSIDNATSNATSAASGTDKLASGSIDTYFPHFQDVNVMIFIGFGFLMTFLCRYALFDCCVNFLLSAFVIEWAVLMGGCFNQLIYKQKSGNCYGMLPNAFDTCIHLDIVTCMDALFTTAAVLISMGAVLGLASPLQLIVMAIPEVVLVHLNYIIVVYYLGANDPGDSMVIHAFGAYFGIAVARVLTTKTMDRAKKHSDAIGTTYSADLFSMIGTLFLWMYWPSFNSGAQNDLERHRTALNTFLSILSSCITAYAISAVVDKKGRFEMEHLQNSTLAGGVAIGSSANMVVHPFGALLIGAGAGAFSVCGYKYVTPWLNERRWSDACGVNNLHGMPGIYSAVISAIVAGTTKVQHYGNDERLYAVLPKLDPEDKNYSPYKQAGIQMAGIIISVLIAFVGGTFSGFVITQSCWDHPDEDQLYDDTEFFVPTYVEDDDGNDGDDDKEKGSDK